MAEKIIKKVEDELNCSICLDTYTNPKLLQCHHVYCRQCLVRLVYRDQQGQLILDCPTCRQVTPVPATGVADLQSAFRIVHLLEILNECKEEESEPACCSEHAEGESKLYCETCGELICLECAIKVASRTRLSPPSSGKLN